MGSIGQPELVKLFCGIIAVDEPCLVEAQNKLRAVFGEIETESAVMPFDFTDYYRKEMGDPLLRKFVAFKELVDPGQLASIKVRTNELEQEFAGTVSGRSCRRVNLDPGYLTGAKLVLATTKDFSHRIYLGQGIYAELTLMFRRNGLTFFEWTYPDYKSGRYDAFFLNVRQCYLAARPQPSAGVRGEP